MDGCPDKNISTLMLDLYLEFTSGSTVVSPFILWEQSLLLLLALPTVYQALGETGMELPESILSLYLVSAHGI